MQNRHLEIMEEEDSDFAVQPAVMQDIIMAVRLMEKKKGQKRKESDLYMDMSMPEDLRDISIMRI